MGKVSHTAGPFALWQARVYEQGRWWRYEVRMPSGGGWNSRGFRTARGATLALKAAMKRKRDAYAAAIAKASGGAE